jgi:hypothetical protein
MEVVIVKDAGYPMIRDSDLVGPQLPIQLVLGAPTPGVEVISHLHQVPELRMCGAIPPLPHMSTWCGA